MKIAEIIEQQIREESATRYAELQLPTEFVAPNYAGRSIVNISSSIVRILGGNLPTPPLDSEIIGDLSTNVHRIVFVIIDAMGYRRFLDALDGNPQNGFHALRRAGAQLVPLTSTFPSTTTAALTALWCGYTPAEHGFVGYQLFLREYGARSDMISFNPVATRELGKEELIRAGLEPAKFLAVPSLPQTLEPLGIPVYNLIEQPFAKSGLSRVQIRGMRETFGFVTSSDMWITLRAQIEQHRAERALFVAYWSAVDSIEHLYGPSSETVIAEINNFAYSFERDFLRQLSADARTGTLFLLTADHGQIDSPVSRAVYLRDHPELREHLVMDFAGEPRAAYFYCRPGELDAARAYITARLGDKFFVLDSPAALQAGLWGTGNISPEVKYRIGDLIALPRADYYFSDRNDPPKMLGRHGGLNEQEMLVPFIAARLDG
jgi:predicted AlkP superfamily pyrophosphatase or phosphodiesterase